MLTLAALALAAASTPSAPTLVATAPWWEKVTMTISGDGKQQTCRFESSLPGNVQSCDVEGSAAAAFTSRDGPPSLFTKVTFERRFSPGRPADTTDLQPGDTLLGQQVMVLTIDADGAVDGCRVLAKSGDLPGYDCEEAKAEKFEASLGESSEAARHAFMTILVYGHTEEVA